ncbi:MAG TPA: bifunctional YncE family protein/alkaline phosphatase family protein [Armatimonadota bacterium]|jgi:YVTN family beta-propeller protein
MRLIAIGLAALVGSGSLVSAAVDHTALVPPNGGATPISENNWGMVTAPVYGTSESGVYKDAELFAGPAKFHSTYYHGVLPNGRIVKPAGISVQVGMNPLAIRLTPDGRYLVTSNDDERNGSVDSPSGKSLRSDVNKGGYSVSVVDAKTMSVVSQIGAGPVFAGLQITGKGPYTVWASGGPSNSIKVFTISPAGVIASGGPDILIAPILPSDKGYVSNYTPAPAFNTANTDGVRPAVPIGFDRASGAHTTYPAGSALSPDGRFLYVACNGDNSVAVIRTASRKVVRQVPVGYFPYDVAVSADGVTVAVSNWGITEYKFKAPEYDEAGRLTAIKPLNGNQPDGFYVPTTDTEGKLPKTSSVSVLIAAGGDGARLEASNSVYHGKALDALNQVGDTHPSALAIAKRTAGRKSENVVFVAKANSDSLGVFVPGAKSRMPDVDLSPVRVSLKDGHPVHGAYPNAIAYSPRDRRLYVAEAGINSVAVLDASNLLRPRLIGRIPTGWYPTGVTISPDGRSLYILNAKGIGEDINPRTPVPSEHNPTGLESFADSNYVFGSVQKMDLAGLRLDNTAVLQSNFALHKPADTSVVPAGGKPSSKIDHVFFILHENKTFDSMLGSAGDHFGPYASLAYNNPDGSAYTDRQYTGVSVNTQSLARNFATAVNYYSDSEESDAGHMFASSGTATDYTEKTLLVKRGRGTLVEKNMEPEDYPEGGFIFNNAARHGVSFKDFGDLIRIAGTDEGTSTPTTMGDPPSGLAGFPALAPDASSVSNPLSTVGDVDSPTRGLGQSYFLSLPILAILGGKNANGEDRLDRNYPGYNFNISDQRRAKEFIRDFDRMVANNTLPKFVHIYQPNDHTGGLQAPNKSEVGGAPLQQVADGDVGLGMVVEHIMRSPAYYNAATGKGSAIFVSYDDAQGCLDHIHPHRTPLLVISPYAKPGYAGKRHYVTASIVKTEELLLGLPPNNLGDLFATDLRDMFQSGYNGITADSLHITKVARYDATPEGKRIWKLVDRLDLSGPDRDSYRVARLGRISAQADTWHREAARRNRLGSPAYARLQDRLFGAATRLVASASRDD